MEAGPEIDLGTPGASARREHDRLRANRENRVRQRRPRIGGLLLKLRDAPGHERAWASGAAGEEELAASLARRCPDAIVLHDRRLPGTRANIDHVAITASGVYVIDAKRYKGRVEIRRPLFGKPALMIAGSNRTKLSDGLKRQVAAVAAATESAGFSVDVRGCLCFVGGAANMPLLRSHTFDGHSLLYPRQLAKRLKRRGGLDGEQRKKLAATLAEALPAA